MSVTSWGLALAISAPKGRPRPSLRTIVLVPLPRLVLPTHSPLFLPRKTCRRRWLLPSGRGRDDRAFARGEPKLSSTDRLRSRLSSGASRLAVKGNGRADLSIWLRYVAST